VRRGVAYFRLRGCRGGVRSIPRKRLRSADRWGGKNRGGVRIPGTDSEPNLPPGGGDQNGKKKLVAFYGKERECRKKSITNSIRGGASNKRKKVSKNLFPMGVPEGRRRGKGA